MRIVRDIVGQAPCDGYRGKEVAPGPNVTSDEEVDAYLRAYATGLFHPVGTARMGVDADSVVDERLVVRGLRNLRVVDASIMPRIVSGNTLAAVVAIAEKAAECHSSNVFRSMRCRPG